jgi:hypothetical protein
MLNRRTSAVAFMTVIALALGISSHARAEDKAGDFTGAWKWTATMRNNTVDFTANLKQEGDKVTGTISGGGGGGGGGAQPAEIKDGKITNGEISFKVVRTRGGNEVTTTYTGKLEGDTIKGKIESTGGGTTRPARDWTATRAKEGAAAAPAAGDAK